MNNIGTETTINTVANALELGAAIAGEVIGREAADSIRNQPLTKGVLQSMLVTEIGNHLSKELGN